MQNTVDDQLCGLDLMGRRFCEGGAGRTSCPHPHRLKVYRTVVLSVGVVMFLIVSSTALAQELEPRAYRTLPVGLNFVVLGASFSTGAVVTEAGSPIQDLSVNVTMFSIGYLRSFGFLGRSSSLTVGVPYAYLTGSAVLDGEVVSGSRSGSADLRVRWAVNLLGGPALSPKEFAGYRQGRNLGVSLAVSAPTGQYDFSRLINFGANRWAFKPEIGYSSIRGRWIFDFAAGVWFFTDNSDFLGGSKRSQDPIGSLQAHVSYNFESGIWLALDANYFTGGRSTIDDTANADLQRSSRVGLTLSLPLGGPHSLKLAAQTGAYTSIGADFDLLSAAYQYRW